MRADGMHGCMRWQERAWKMQPYLVDRMYHRGGLFARARVCAPRAKRTRCDGGRMRAQLEIRSKSASDGQKRKWKKVNKDATRCDRALRLRKDRRDRDQNA